MNQEIKQKIKNIAKQIIRVVLIIVSLLAMINLFRWLGYKGFFGFVLGMAAMGYLLLSKNIVFRSLIGYFDADDFLDDLKKK